MSAIRREPFKSAPRTFRKKSDSPGRSYSETTPPRRFADTGFREERSERSERSERRPARPYGFDHRDRERGEPMHVIRRPPSAVPQEVRRPSPAVAEEDRQPVPIYKLKKGFEAAQADIIEMINAVAGALSDSGHVSEVELSVSFNRDGKFIGFGAGGAATIKVRIAPMG